MKSLITFLIIISVFSVLFCSDKITGPTLPNDVPLENLVAFKAQFTGGNPYFTRLVLMDFYDKNNFKLIYSDSVFVTGYTEFSPDKAKIITNGNELTWSRGYPYPFFIYDIKDNSYTRVKGTHIETGNSIFPALKNPLWFNDGSGFFYNEYHYFGHGDNIYLFYDIHKQEFSNTGHHADRSIYPLGLREDKSIIGLFKEGEKKYKLIYSEPGKDTLMFIPNIVVAGKEILLHSDSYGINIELDMGTEMFVFSEYLSNNGFTKISVTNLDGTYYKTYTSGEYKDYGPVWGPDGRFILFQRDAMNNGGSKFMSLNVSTGEVAEFLRPQQIGAVNIYGLDY